MTAAVPSPSRQRVEDLRRGLTQVRHRIETACAQVDRDPDGVTLVVVTKTHPASDVVALLDLGVCDIGENRDQEAADKVAQVRGSGHQVRVHFVGQVQSNKAVSVASYAQVVHSVDRLSLVRALDRATRRSARDLSVFVQVALHDEALTARGGTGIGEAQLLAQAVHDSAYLHLIGVMAVAPLGGDPLVSFRRLAAVRDDLQERWPDAVMMSAGMSGDLEAAVTAGATHLRVGSAILGSRPALR